MPNVRTTSVRGPDRTFAPFCLGGTGFQHVAADVEEILGSAEQKLLRDWIFDRIERKLELPDGDLKTVLRQNRGVVGVVARRHGKQVSITDAACEHLDEALVECLQNIDFDDADTFELVFAFNGQPVDTTDDSSWNRLNAGNKRGIVGVELKLRADPSIRAFVGPTTVISTNRKLEKWIGQFARENGLDTEKNLQDIEVTEFQCQQFLVSRDQRRIDRLLRGAKLTTPDDITETSINELGDLLTGYLKRSVKSNGRMVYLYHPSQGKEADNRNNSIRQWMATLALVRIHQFSQAADDLQLAEKNLKHNLDVSFEMDGPFGMINENEKVKLGAVALAALAILELPNDRYPTELNSLFTTINHLWEDSGRFRTFYRPPLRNDLQNFYSGEALLSWGHLYKATKSVTLRQRFMRSFEYYRRWHLENRNPAFIPWHTQAYYLVWLESRDEQLRDFIFEMNDWLIEIQQWTDAPALDCRGRFYDPNRPYGPPHASSTGVYLEGLVDAFALARECNEIERQEKYRIAILRGLRSIRQLTFKDETDMFYINQRSLLKGGVRTTVYNNVVRVDNVQHNLLAIQKVQTTFDSPDFDWTP